MTSVGDICLFATLTRVATVIFGILSYTWTGSYDTSAEIILPIDPAYNHLRFLNVFIRWDAIYFLHIAEHGYVYEQETAFFPFLPYLANYLSQTVFMPLQAVVGRQYTIVIVAALISNISFVFAAGYLFKLTRLIYPANTQLAKYSAVAFCISLPSMFMSAFYTESLFALLSFMGMYHITKQRYLLASILWGLASSTRSNAIIYAGFFIYELIISRFRRHSLMSLIFGCFQTALYSLITVSGFVAFQYSLYLQYCVDTSPEGPRPWCTRMPPLVYTYIQKENWGNGFLAYYELKQIPNFLLAMPVIGLSVAGLWTFISKDWKRWLSLGQSNHASSVILRFFTALPPLYWYIGHVWSLHLRSSASTTKYLHWLANGILYYSVLYSLIGVILFSAFLPPA
ncbi:hypothetical protein [Absidia glauca]|uniref:GPI mannosyltransferase 2 n=1 Tax=Absidia glauca TaxID=4829 RepID=A0A163JLR6_ABSGL|nr:hypothetical protein [Absidia glauca]